MNNRIGFDYEVHKLLNKQGFSVSVITPSQAVDLDTAIVSLSQIVDKLKLFREACEGTLAHEKKVVE